MKYYTNWFIVINFKFLTCNIDWPSILSDNHVFGSYNFNACSTNIFYRIILLRVDKNIFVAVIIKLNLSETCVPKLFTKYSNMREAMISNTSLKEKYWLNTYIYVMSISLAFTHGSSLIIIPRSHAYYFVHTWKIINRYREK